MFGIAAPSGGLYLTLSQLPQSVLEGVFAFVLVFLLGLPLAAVIHLLLEDAFKDSGNVRGVGTGVKYEPSRAADHCPPTAATDASLRFDRYGPSDEDDKMQREERASDFDYRAYRHWLMEEVLMKYYAERQPPGQVVMNSIHLNSLEDTKYHSKERDLFGFLGESHETLDRKNASYRHPLDHFLVKGNRRPTTEDKSMETKSPSLWSIPYMTSDARLSSAKNNAGSPPRTPQNRPRYEAEDRPKTAGSPFPSPRSSKSRSHQKPCYRAQPAEILRIDREDSSRLLREHTAQSVYNCNDVSRERENSRPPTAGESSSDLCSTMYDPESKHRQLRDDPKNLKRPWLYSCKRESYNRKYGKQLRESSFDVRWRMRKTSPQRRVAGSSTASLRSAVSRSPSPVSDSSQLRKGSEVLEKVTLLSSIHVERGKTENCSQETLRDGNPAGAATSRELVNSLDSPLASKSRASAVPSIASGPGTPRRKLSRLPLHVNSKKPIKTSSHAEAEGDDRAKSEDKRPATVKPVSEIPEAKQQRPRTTSGAVGRNASKLRIPRNEEAQESKEPRPKTTDVDENKKEAEETGKRPVTWSAGLAKTKRKPKNKEPPRADESEIPQKDQQLPRRKLKVAANQGLKTYIEKLKVVLADQEPDAVADSANLAGLSLIEAVTAEIEANLSSSEMHELGNLLRSVEKKVVLGSSEKARRDVTA